jgi:S-adenosylmethionine decarboxylase
VLDRYHAIDSNIFKENVFHTKMMLREFNLDNYLFSTKKLELTDDERKEIRSKLKTEMEEIYYGKNYN